MSVKVYCKVCGRSVVLDFFRDYHRGKCECGQTITARADSFGKIYYTYSAPDLGASVEDGIGTQDKFGG